MKLTQTGTHRHTRAHAQGREGREGRQGKANTHARTYTRVPRGGWGAGWGDGWGGGVAVLINWWL